MAEEFIREIKLDSFTTEVTLASDNRLIDGIEGVTVFDKNTEIFFPGITSKKVVLPSGERGKRFCKVEKILKEAFSARLERGGYFVGIGGGVVCDTTAMAASLYMRGARLILIPTTLLAMVDAAIGGKSGINYRGYKNMIGSFYPASKVVIAPQILKTLSDREYMSGLAEVLKSALLSGNPFYHSLLDKKGEILERSSEEMGEAILSSIKYKADVVERDFRESGERQFLNFGHTFGHGLEKLYRGRVSHGAAVAWGMAKASVIGMALGITDKSEGKMVIETIRSFGYTLDYRYSSKKLLESMMRDKKNRGGEIRLILLERIGKPVIHSVDPDTLVKWL